MKNNILSQPNLPWLLVILLGVILAYVSLSNSLTNVALDDEELSPTVTEGANVGATKQPVVKGTTGAIRLNSVTPMYGGTDARVVLKGTGFSATGNSIILRAKDKNILPWYVLKAINVGSSDNGSLITMTVSGSSFFYGECTFGKPYCNLSAQKIQTGEYQVSVAPKGCTTKSCESNSMTYVVTP